MLKHEEYSADDKPICSLGDKVDLERHGEYTQLLLLLNRYDNLQDKLHEKLVDGSIYLTQAKYYMGDDRITQHSYDYRMQSEIDIDLPADVPEGMAEYTIRHRKPDTDEATSGVGVKPSPASRGIDPIKWFGLLVPKSLHSSQQSFRGSVTLLIQLAKLKNEILDILDRLQTASK